MGIPVVYFGDPNDSRISLLTDIGIRIHAYHRSGHPLKRNLYRLFFRMFRAGKINWNPAPVDLDREKSTIIATLKKLLFEHGVAATLTAIKKD